jgi:hypothetical protein
MADGIYILANDVVFDHLVALLNSLEVNGAKDIPVCIIPYDDRMEKVRVEIAIRHNVTLFENTDSIDFWEDFATQAWTSHRKAQKVWQAKGWQQVHCLGMHRKFCCFDGHFDKFVYFDCDTLLMGSLDYIYQKLDEFDWVANDFQYKSDLNYVFDLSSPKLAEIFNLFQLDSHIFCAGWFAAKKGILNRNNSNQLLENLISGEAEILSLRGTDQPLFNYLVARSGISFYNFAYHQPAGVTGNHWSSQFDVIDYVLYDKGRRLTYLHYMSISAAKINQLCAGEDVEIPYRNVFLHYRYLKSPEKCPKLKSPSWLVRGYRNAKTFVRQKNINFRYRLANTEMNILRKAGRKTRSLQLENKVYQQYYKIMMDLRTSLLGVRLISIRRPSVANRSKISLAITHFNRSSLVVGALCNALYDDRIDDIIIYDDASSPEEFSRMQANIANLSPKISIRRGEQNFGAYKSKIMAISYCKNEWAIILDSDNALSETYVDRLYHISAWNPKLIYCPTSANPYFNFKLFSDTEINLEKARELILNNPHPKLFRNFINDGNYFVNVQKYLDCAKDNQDICVQASDVAAFNYLWLKSGGSLYAVSNLSYYHRQHSGSYWLSTMTDSKKVLNKIIEAITNHKKCDFF